MSRKPGIEQLARDLTSGQTSSAALVEEALMLAQETGGEGDRVFIRLYADAAREAARASDRLREHGIVPSPLAGVPVSIKDLFDVAGETTLSGSAVLKDAPPANKDATIVRRLRAAGAVIVGRTNMTEFAYSGLGLNPHYGTPGNPHDRSLIPGGSSSGAGVAVADGMSVASIGTDTGGSVRIPAALCGIVGFKPTTNRIPRDGAMPLSPTLDSIGPLAPDVATCALVDSLIAGDAPDAGEEIPLDGLRIGIPLRYVLDDLDGPVMTGFQRALHRLKSAGARLVEIAFSELEELPQIHATGTFASAEGYAWHRRLLNNCEDQYDPRVAARLLAGADLTAGDYLDLIAARADLIRRASHVTAPFDVVAMPTVPQIAPVIADLENDDAAYWAANSLFLRNPSIANFLDRCALTVPCHEPGTAPVGFMIMGEHGADRRVLGIGRAVERALRFD